MNSSIYRFTLGMNSSQSQISIPVMLGDTGREWHINLSDGGKPYIIADGCLAMLSIKRPSGSRLEEPCSIAENTTIVYDFMQNKNTCANEGIHNCDITLYGSDGKLITTARFTMVVSERTVPRDDIVLTDEDYTAVDAMLVAEANRQAKEIERQSAETERISAESRRVDNEEARQFYERSRSADELSRASAENERIASEGERKTAEKERVSNENSRIEKDAHRDASISNALEISGRAEKNSSDAVNDVADLKEEFGSEALIMGEATVKGAVNYAVSIANDAKAQSDATRTTLISLSAQVQGIGRSYVVPNFTYFIEFLTSAKSVELKEDRDGDGVEETYNVYISDLKSGDNIIIIEKEVPDFWFEKNSALTSFETYPYNDKEYVLTAKVGGVVIGGAHILESDYTVIDGFATSAAASAAHAYDSATRALASENQAKKYAEDANISTSAIPTDVIDSIIDTVFNIIVFTVDGVTYTARVGMTWAEFIESDYNPTNDDGSRAFYLYGVGNGVWSGADAGGELYYGTNKVYESDAIVASSNYQFL